MLAGIIGIGVPKFLWIGDEDAKLCRVYVTDDAFTAAFCLGMSQGVKHVCVVIWDADPRIGFDFLSHCESVEF